MKKGCFWLILSFLSIGQLFSQRVLTLEECRTLAIENSKSLKIADASVQSAYYERKDAFTKYFPELSFSGTYLRTNKNFHLIPSSVTIPGNVGGIQLPVDGLEIPIPERIREIGDIDLRNLWLGGFNLIQPIFTGGKIVAYNDIMKNAEELAKVGKDAKLTDVIVDVDNAYWLVVSLSSKRGLAQSFVELMKKMEYDITVMEEEGVATKADRLSVSVKLNEAEVALTKVDNGLTLARMYLAQLCGLDLYDNYTLYDEDADILSAYVENLNDINIDQAIESRDEIKSLKIATKILKGKERVVYSDFLPQVGFTANYLWTNPSLSKTKGVDNKFSGLWNVGVAVEVPLNYFSTSAKYKAAKSQTLIAQYQLEDAREKIELQINESVFKVNEANKMLRTSAENMDKADENLRYADAGFQEGVISAADVMAAHTAWIGAHSEFIDAQINVKLTKVYLDKALGRTIPNLY